VKAIRIELTPIHPAPGSLSAALDAIETDHDFLIKGELCPEDISGPIPDISMGTGTILWE
jgi:hypothetical protein